MINLLIKESSSKARLTTALLLSFLFIYPIFSSGVYYIDDLERSQNGISGWTYLGRPLSDLIFWLFSLGHQGSIDISPLPQIASIIVMGVSIHYFSKKIFNYPSISSVLITSLIFLHPLFLHNISYRYDSLSMVISISLCLYSFALDTKKATLNIVLKSLLILASLCLYQVSAVVFIMLLMLSETMKVLENRRINKITLTSDLSSIVIAYFLYSILLKFISDNNRSETVFSHENWANLILINYKKIESLYIMSYDKLSLLVLMVTFIVGSALYVAKLIKDFKNRCASNKFLSIISIASPFLIVIASCITVLILKESLILPRIATSFGVIVFSTIYMLNYFSRKCASIVSLYLCMSVILTSFALGSAMKSQYEKDIFIAAQIKSSIDNNEVSRNSKTTVIGVASSSIVEENNSRVFPVIGLINSPMYDNTGSLLLKRLGLNGVNFSFDRKTWIPKALSVCKASYPLAYNQSFSIYNQDGQNYVFLGVSNKQCRQPKE
ncbi:glucosyltransferase domain-containing protein [Huaxiibacter chinensis]